MRRVNPAVMGQAVRRLEESYGGSNDQRRRSYACPTRNLPFSQCDEDVDVDQHHNQQVGEYGMCRCACHWDSTLTCTCGPIPGWMKGPIRISLPATRLSSRVKPKGVGMARAWQSELTNRIYAGPNRVRVSSREVRYG